jgi:multiple antibiotic resistance protein
MMSAALNSFLVVFAGLIPIVNPPGSALLFLAMTRRGTSAERSELARRIAIYAFLIMIVSLYVGAFVLKLFGISVPVLRVAGGLVLAFAGWRALDAPRQRTDAQTPEAADDSDLAGMAFYPLTMPLTAGPGTVAVAIALGTSGSGTADMPWPTVIGGMLAALLATLAIAGLVYVCYRFADRLEMALGERGSDALGRLFAFILICLGIQIFWIGFAELWASLPAR